MQHNIFISYSHLDAELACILDEKLRAAGLRCFRAEKDIGVTELWQQRSREALRTSERILLLITEHSKDSLWVVAEAGAAWGLGKEVVPILARMQPSGLLDPIRAHQARIIETPEQIDALVAELSRHGSVGKQFSRSDFNRVARAHCFSSIDGEKRRNNLASGDWRYDLILPQLMKNGWTRFAAGFKAGLYAHEDKDWCLKIMGMGVGDNPTYFAGRGDHVAHERAMLQAFTDRGFSFQPLVKSITESITFLTDECGVNKSEAEWQCTENHILITELILGVPFATPTGHPLNYEPDIAIFDSYVLREAEHALQKLQTQLGDANTLGLLHNDPMPPNIVFAQDDQRGLVARLIDFEVAQDLHGCTPLYVESSLKELRDELQVPLNPRTGKRTKNLDQHIMDQVVQVLSEVRCAIEGMEHGPTHSGRHSFTIPFLSGNMNIGKARNFWCERVGGC